MKAKEARELTEHTINEKKRSELIKKSLSTVFDKILDQTDRGSYVLSYPLEDLHPNQQTYLRNLGYKLNFKTEYSNFLGPTISWK